MGSEYGKPHQRRKLPLPDLFRCASLLLPCPSVFCASVGAAAACASLLAGSSVFSPFDSSQILPAGEGRDVFFIEVDRPLARSGI